MVSKGKELRGLAKPKWRFIRYKIAVTLLSVVGVFLVQTAHYKDTSKDKNIAFAAPRTQNPIPTPKAVIIPPTPKPTIAPTIKPVQIPIQHPKPVPTPQIVLAAVHVTTVVQIIDHWADYYGISRAKMERVSMCESGQDMSAVNYHYTAQGQHPTGLFQFLASTFYAYAAQAGITSPDLSSASQQAQVAAYAFTHGGASNWACQ